MHKGTIWRSLRLRLFIYIFIAGILSSIAMGFILTRTYESRAVLVRTSEVKNQVNILARHLIKYNYLSDTSSEVVNAELSMLSKLYESRVVIINENLKVIKDSYGISEGKTFVSEEVIGCLNGTDTVRYDDVNGFIEITAPIREENTDYLEENSNPIKGVMLVAVSTDSINTTLSIISRRMNIAELILAIVLCALSAYSSLRLVKPFNIISKEISEVRETGVFEHISPLKYSETEHLVEGFNELMDHIAEDEKRRRDFVANVSHELKTPLTSIKVLSDSLIADDDVPVEIYREFMDDIAKEIDRENKIINDLLSLSRLDNDNVVMNFEMTDVSLLCEEVMHRLRPLAKKERIELLLVTVRNVEAQIDRVKFSLVLMNLIENGIKYNKPGGKVTVYVDGDHQYAMITVSDTGYGIPKEDIDYIYNRFYRVDKSHSRQIGGTGLGLAIARTALVLHRGSIRVESELEKGSSFYVKIPLRQSKKSLEGKLPISIEDMDE